MEKIRKSDEEWKKVLSNEQFEVLRKKKTEMPFSGKLLNNKKLGTYICAACKNKLFKSNDKFNSGSGWPSFTKPINKDNIDVEDDLSLGMKRFEVKCSKCDSHLGHVFDDGPKPEGKRYCINSISLDFIEEKK